MIDKNHEQNQAAKKVQLNQSLRFSLHAKPEKLPNPAANVMGAIPPEEWRTAPRVYPYLSERVFRAGNIG
jgi:hypothetical protein